MKSHAILFAATAMLVAASPAVAGDAAPGNGNRAPAEPGARAMLDGGRLPVLEGQLADQPAATPPKPVIAGAGPRLSPEELRPAFVRPLLPQVEIGRNDSGPTWAPTNDMLAFERSEEGKREIIISRTNGTLVKKVYYQAEADDLGLSQLMPNLAGTVSYNAGLAWAPSGGQFVFMSNGGEGNYDLFLDALAAGGAQRLTQDPQKDGQPDWSPTGNSVVFVSGRTGGAQLYRLDVATRQVARISEGDQTYLYPRWSPDGKKIAAIYGSNENHDIVVIDDLSQPLTSRRSLTTWQYDDLSPVWSPDGRKIAFYTNFNRAQDPKVWAIVVVKADGSSPAAGEALAAQVVAENVIPDVATGPAWLPDSRRIAYVRNDKDDYSPIYIVDAETRISRKLATGTNINHDVSCSRQGVLAFRAQVEQWDQIYLAGTADSER